MELDVFSDKLALGTSGSFAEMEGCESARRILWMYSAPSELPGAIGMTVMS